MSKCKQCGDCCRSVQVGIMQAPENINNLEDIIEFYEARGAKVYLSNDNVIVEFAFACPNLKDNLCTIHESKPRACKEAPCIKNLPNFIGGVYHA